MATLDLTDLESRVVGNLLRRQADADGDRIWLRQGTGAVTFGDAHDIVNRYANGLADKGVGAGDTVAMLMESSTELVLAGLAATRLGAIFTPVSTDFKGPFLASALAATRSRVLIVDDELAPRLADLGAPVRIEHVIVNGTTTVIDGQQAEVIPLASLRTFPSTGHPHDANYGDVMQMWWSSGTTGKPKGIMHTHSSLLRSVELSLRHRDVRPDDVLYSCTPMYLGSPWTGSIWPALITGAQAAIDPRFSVSSFWDRTRFYGATHFMTLGAMHMFLWQAPEQPDDADNPIRVGLAAPMTWDIIPQFKERFGIERMPQVYGQSETPSGVFWAPDDGTAWKRNSMGRAVDWYEVKLFDENDHEVPVGEVGDISVRPLEPFILFAGYFDMPDLTVNTWRNLWHHTGDMAVCDEDGEYFFADRKKDYIRNKGRNISMVEVEDVVSTHAAVREVAAYGIPSAEIESEAELMVCVALQAGATLDAEELARHINDHAPYYFVPRYVEFLQELPRNHHGRVEKYKLRDRGVTSATWDRVSAGYDVVR